MRYITTLHNGQPAVHIGVADGTLVTRLGRSGVGGFAKEFHGLKGASLSCASLSVCSRASALVAAVIQYSGSIFAIKILQDYADNIAKILPGCQRNLKYCFATILCRVAVLLEYCRMLQLLCEYCIYNIARILLDTAIMA
jgi:hypothetical protein